MTISAKSREGKKGRSLFFDQETGRRLRVTAARGSSVGGGMERLINLKPRRQGSCHRSGCAQDIKGRECARRGEGGPEINYVEASRSLRNFASYAQSRRKKGHRGMAIGKNKRIKNRGRSATQLAKKANVESEKRRDRATGCEAMPKNQREGGEKNKDQQRQCASGAQPSLRLNCRGEKAQHVGKMKKRQLL